MKSPKVGFVSLGCPKALVDSERILTQLKTEGYEVAQDYDGADLVVVNTCGFIESAVQESLDAIGEAISENGKVIVTGCLGKDEAKIRDMHPSVLKGHRCGGLSRCHGCGASLRPTTTETQSFCRSRS